MTKLKVIELFAGIGSQTQALKNIGVEHEVVAISEIDKYAIRSYMALHGDTVNLGDITKIEELPMADLWTYSFPCTDISVAGKGEGLAKGSGTRSGLLWEVERLLLKAKEQGKLPKYLLLENVKNLIGKKFKADYDKWLAFLSGIGYHNYWKVLNAKDFGIPQNRERVFCISCLEEIEYTFPEKQPLTKRLRDVIDEVVDDRYYLKESTIRSIMRSTYNSRRDSIRSKEGIVNTLRARDYREPQCVQIGEVIGGKWDKMHEISRRVYDEDGIAPTVHCQQGGNTELKIAAMRGRNPENASDRRSGSPTEQMLEINEKGISNALTTVQKDNLVVENAYVARKYDEFVKKNGYLPEMFLAYNNREIKELAPTLTVQCSSFGGSSAVLKLEKVNPDKMSSEDIMNARIRKLTPKECLRLMGWQDQQIEKIERAGVSATQQYRQAGNGIVVQVLESLFRNLFTEENKEKK